MSEIRASFAFVTGLNPQLFEIKRIPAIGFGHVLHHLRVSTFGKEKCRQYYFPKIWNNPGQISK